MFIALSYTKDAKVSLKNYHRLSVTTLWS